MIKNIIFDLGGVVIDLGFDKMVKQFDLLGVENFGNYFNPLTQVAFFEQLELGEISPEEFYGKFRETFLTELSNEQIKATWNLILEDFEPQRMKLLDQLSKRYALYLFSNTNAIHAACFEAKCLTQMGRSLPSYFQKTFYSHELHLRKPDVLAFQEVMKQAGLLVQETLFIDDNPDNIAGAKKLGLKTYHLISPQTIVDLDFSKISI